jgi:predicted ATPase/DNA-binding SARP family transcriptional activator
MAINATPKQPETLQIHLLGDFCICIGEKSLEANHWKLRKAKTLIKLLALAPHHRLHREELMDSLWPEADLQAATDSLHQTLHNLRSNLKPYCSNPRHYIQVENEMVSLCPDTPLWIDMEAFEAAAQEATRSRDPESYQVALALYTGDLLPEDLYEDWAINRREELRKEYIHLSFELGKLFESREEFPHAIETFRKILASDPLQEEAHTSLMHAYAMSGQRTQAISQFRTLQEVLRKELGAEPDLQSTLLYQEILAGRFPTSKIVSRTYTQPSPRHNLPSLLSTFIGREKDVEQVGRLTTQSRLVTLSGPGGVGKTRLALRAAMEQLPAYPDGAWLVELDALSKGQLVPYAIADVFGVKEEEEGMVLENLKESLRTQKLLLVLDNCEHLLEACARISDALFRDCPNLHILATSREALGINGEIVFPVPSLTFPDPSSLPPVTSLSQYEAVQLFKERAQAVKPSFEIVKENAPSIAQICQQLDGIPLAIELAAARSNVLSVEQIADRLDDRFRLLTGGSRTTIPRQQTLMASIDWSYNLLSEAERLLFCRLSVFVGGWTLAAVEEVCTDAVLQPGEILDLLSQLINKSLVDVGSETGREKRYQLLETIRQYASEKITGSEEWVSVSNRHLAYYLQLVEEIEPKLDTGEQLECMHLLKEEQGNLRRALGWALVENQKLFEKEGLRMASALHQFWLYYGLAGEGYDWLKRGLDFMEGENEQFIPLQAKALSSYGVMNQYFLLPKEAIKSIEKSLALYRRCGDKAGIAQAIIRLRNAVFEKSIEVEKVRPLLDEAVQLAGEAGNLDILANALICKASLTIDETVAKEFVEEGLRIFQEKGDIWGVIFALGVLGNLALSCGDYTKVQAYSEEILRLSLETENKSHLANAYILMGSSAYAQHDFVEMEALFLEGLAIKTELGSLGGQIYALRQLGIAAKRQGEFSRAVNYLMQSLSRGEKINDVHGNILCIGLMAGLAAERGQLSRAVVLFGAEASLLSSEHLTLDPFEGKEYARDTSALRAQLDEATYQSYWVQGEKLTLEQAMADAVAIGAELNLINTSADE